MHCDGVGGVAILQYSRRSSIVPILGPTTTTTRVRAGCTSEVDVGFTRWLSSSVCLDEMDRWAQMLDAGALM